MRGLADPGSFWLMLAVMVLELLHLAREFPAVEASIGQDPLLTRLCRASPLIMMGIFGLDLASRFWM